MQDMGEKKASKCLVTFFYLSYCCRTSAEVSVYVLSELTSYFTFLFAQLARLSFQSRMLDLFLCFY